MVYIDLSQRKLLFLFLSGFILDVFLHLLAINKIFASSLIPYYKSLESHPPGIIPNKTIRKYFWGGIWGGIIVIIGYIFAEILMQLF